MLKNVIDPVWPKKDFPDLSYMPDDAAQKSVSAMGCRLQRNAMERLTVAGQPSFMVRIDEEHVLVGRRTQMNEQELRAHVQIDTRPSGSAASDTDVVLNQVLAEFPQANLAKLRSVAAHYLNAQLANPFDRIALHLNLLGGQTLRKRLRVEGYSQTVRITVPRAGNVVEHLSQSEAVVKSVEMPVICEDTLLPSISRILYGDEGSFDVVGSAFTIFMRRRAADYGARKLEIVKIFPLKQSFTTIGISYQYFNPNIALKNRPTTHNA